MGNLAAWKTLVKYDTSMIDETSGYKETFLEYYLTHCINFFASQDEFFAAVEEIVRVNKEARRSPSAGDINFDDLFEVLSPARPLVTPLFTALSLSFLGARRRRLRSDHKTRRPPLRLPRECVGDCLGRRTPMAHV